MFQLFFVLTTFQVHDVPKNYIIELYITHAPSAMLPSNLL